MKIINKKIVLLIMVISIVVLMGATECMCSLDFHDYTANVVSIQASDDTNSLSLEDATINLYAYNSNYGTYSTLTDTTKVFSDSFSLLIPESGRYMITGSKSGWTFVPLYFEVDVTGVVSKDLYAYPTVQIVDNIEHEAEYTIIARWEDSDIDIDLVLTYGDDGDSAATTNWNTGDEDSEFNRFRITPYDSPAHTGTREGIKHHGDVNENSASTTPRVETISIFSDLWFQNGDTIRIYVDAPNPTSSPLLTGNQFTGDDDDTSPAAFVQLDIMRRYDSNNNGSLDTDAHYGTWYAPYNTFEETLHLVTADFTDGTPGNLLFYSANNVTDTKSIIKE